MTYDYRSPKPVYAGAYVYNITLENGFQLKGKITHFTNTEQEQFGTDGYISDYSKMIQRIIYIGENLYTISQSMVQANGLSDLAEKNAITLGGE